MKRTLHDSVDNLTVDRRRFLGSALGACAVCPPLDLLSLQLAASMSGSFQKNSVTA